MNRLQTAKKLKDQNTKLKDQLKELKFALRNTLGRVTAKKVQKDTPVDKSMDSRESALSKELESSHKQISQYKKEIQAIKNRLEAFHNQERFIFVLRKFSYYPEL